MNMLGKEYIYIHIPKTAGRSICFSIDPNFRREHKTISDYCLLLKEEVVRCYFKFTCVRNPWDRAVSWWAFFGNMGLKRKTFDEWIKNMGKLGIPRRHSGKFPLDQMTYCKSPSGEVLMDRFIRFERLEDDWTPIARRIGAQEKLPSIGMEHKQMLPRMREAMLRSKHPELAPLLPTPDFHDMYTTQESIDIVAQLDAETISRFGYTFR